MVMLNEIFGDQPMKPSLLGEFDAVIAVIDVTLSGLGIERADAA